MTGKEQAMKSQRNAGRRYAVSAGCMDPGESHYFNPWRGEKQNAWGAKDIYAPQWDEGFAQGCEDNAVRAEEAAEALQDEAVQPG
jgi:hypothetical protein